jgi:hypothetical protein
VRRAALLAVLALAGCVAASRAPAAPAPRQLDVRLFHASAPAIEAVGIPLADLIDASDPRRWSVRSFEKDEWSAAVARLMDSPAVREIKIPGAGRGVAVTREVPWQLDGAVKMAVFSGGSGASSPAVVELPLRLAAWIEGEASDAPVRIEALIPTGWTSADAGIPLATRVELELGPQPVLAVSVTCEAGTCLANVLAIQAQDE